MTDNTSDVMVNKIAREIMNMPSYIKIVKVNNNSRMNGRYPDKELLMLVNTSQYDNFMNMFKNVTGMFGNSSAGLHESLIGSLNKGYYNEMEAGATEGGYGPQGKNLPANNPNRRRYEDYNKTYNNSNRYNNYDMNGNRYYNNDYNNGNDYDNSDTYGQGPGCTPNVDGSRDRRCRDNNMNNMNSNSNSNNSNYQNQGGTSATVGDKLHPEQSLLSTILTRK
ncbi:unknown similar to AMEV151 [Adoxophyes honmai entomopoxvirus 'L']|uniref:Uncharacterized protein n=1 Tax=Adoxophyes honmai entomopoxvirus 'L' TaxID=1293540 RepID=A0A916P699_9POXV|nr:unknown similar to AMEV151 [Adoxophyes honmai entomopoxvirus 'L']CCU55500.1 unknown similar to AMEV151 [Adoxophyes honmai entomopoxvirus 'L']